MTEMAWSQARGVVRSLRRWSVVYRVTGWALIATSLVLTVRLGLVVAATPSELWTEEFVPVADGARPAETGGFPVRLSGFVSDPAIARALIGDCIERSASPLSDVRAYCMAAVDYALAAQPTSAELWLARARLLAAQGILDEPLADSLRRSYELGPREGWIAAERLPFALRLRDFLPAVFVDDIGADLQLVLVSRQLSAPLIETYIADPFLRESSWQVIEQYATLDQQEMLLDWLFQAVRARGP
jgi:hypothetical protein